MKALGYLEKIFGCCCGSREKYPDLKKPEAGGWAAQDESLPPPEARSRTAWSKTMADGAIPAASYMAVIDSCVQTQAGVRDERSHAISNATARYLSLLDRSGTGEGWQPALRETGISQVVGMQASRLSISPDDREYDPTVKSHSLSPLDSADDNLQSTSTLKQGLESEILSGEDWEKGVPLVRSELFDSRQ